MFAMVVLALATALASGPARAEVDSISWRIDTGHSEVTFRIRHPMSRVRGRFDQWQGSVVADPGDFANGSVDVTIQAASINTAHQRRDNDLRSASFFLVGEVVLEGEYLGSTGRSEPRQHCLGFTAATRIDRTQFGIVWNRAVEGGGVLLGDEVEIEVNIEAVRQ